MPYEMWWAIEGRLVYQRCYGALTIEEMAACNRDYIGYVKAGTPLISTIVDLTAVTSFPMNPSQYAEAFKRDKEITERTKWTIVVGANPIIRFIGNIVTQLWKSLDFRVFATREEALDYLKRVDITLDFSAYKERTPELEKV